MSTSDYATRRVIPFRNADGRLRFAHEVPEIPDALGYPVRSVADSRLFAAVRSDDPLQYADGWIQRQVFRDDGVADASWKDRMCAAQLHAPADFGDCWPETIGVSVDGYVNHHIDGGLYQSNVEFFGGYDYHKEDAVETGYHSQRVTYKHVFDEFTGSIVHGISGTGEPITISWKITPTGWLTFHSRDSRAPICFLTEPLVTGETFYISQCPGIDDCPHTATTTTARWIMSFDSQYIQSYVHDGITHESAYVDGGIGVSECVDEYHNQLDCAEWDEDNFGFRTSSDICVQCQYAPSVLSGEVGPDTEVQMWGTGGVPAYPSNKGCATYYWSILPCSVPEKMAEDSAWIYLSQFQSQYAFCYLADLVTDLRIQIIGVQ